MEKPLHNDTFNGHFISLLIIATTNFYKSIKSPHEFIYKVCNYSFTIWYMVFYKHGEGTAIFRLI